MIIVKRAARFSSLLVLLTVVGVFVNLPTATGRPQHHLANISAQSSELGAAPTHQPNPTPVVGKAVLCGHNYRAIVSQDGHPVPFYVRNAYWLGTGESCIRTNGGPSFTVLKTPTASSDVVAFPDIGKGCHWGFCSPRTNLPAPVKTISHEHSYVYAPHHPWGTWNKGYDIWFGRKRQVWQHPYGAELMIWNDQHGICCALASDAKRMTIDHRCFIRTYWRMHDQHAGWNYIQYRACHSSPYLHIDIVDFIHNAERLGQIRRRWWEECAEYGFEEWWGGYYKHHRGGLQVNQFRLHIGV